MTFAYQFDPDAADDLEKEVAHYNQAQPGLGLGDRFFAEVLAQLDWIAQGPWTFQSYAGIAGVHRLVMPKPWPFIIVFAFDGTLVVVLAVAHARRHPDYWRHRAR